MSRKYLIFLFVAVLSMGCGSRSLERPDVPIAWGMRLNEPADAAELSPNLAKLRELVLRSLMVELPLVADSAGMPRIKVDVPGETVGLMGRFKTRLHLAICNNNELELFPIGRPADTQAWFGALETEVRRNLQVLAAYPPERVILGGDLLQVAHAKAEWQALLQGLRRDFPKTKFSIGGRTGFLASSGMGALSDELCIDYQPMAGEELKAESRSENQRIAAVSDSLHKPIFIYRANIIGEEALLQFKNRLRFWSEEADLLGICLNSLYPQIPARDDHTYYGLADDADLLEYLETYRRTAYE